MAAFRVLQVFTIMNRGGAESMIMNYYRKIDKDKVQFDFLVFRKEKAAFDDEIEHLGGKIFKLDPINPLFPKSSYNDLRIFFDTHQDYSVIHSHLNTFSSFPLKVASEFNIPCRIAHAHIALDKVSLKSLVTQKESLPEVIKKIIKLHLKKSIHRYTTHYFSCGRKAGEWLFGKSTPFFTMNNAIDTEKFRFDPVLRKKYREKSGIDKELVIGHIGRFDSQKNHIFLLQIFTSLLDINPNSKLVLIGDGSLKNEIEKETKIRSIDDKVEFLGVRTDIPELCQMMDVFVFPSFYEGLPVTLIEAQAAGLRVLAADTITEEVRLSNLIEFLSLKESPEFWAKKILDMDITTRSNTQKLIVDRGYDIYSNTLQMQEFYLQQNNN